MATTQRGIYYNTDYDSEADVLKDMKKMAASTDTAIDDAVQGIEQDSSSKYSLITETGNKVELEMNQSTFKIKVKLYDKNDRLINESNEIDLPLESVVVNATYDSTNKEIVLTLQNGNTVSFSISDLIVGLVSSDDFETAMEEIQSQLSEKAKQTDVEKNTNDIEALQEENKELNQRLTDAESNQLTGTANGTSIDLTDSADYRVKSIALSGHSEQETTEGKNYLNPQGWDGNTSKGITTTISDYELTIDGKSTGSTGSTLFTSFHLKAGTYVICEKYKSGKINSGSFMLIGRTNLNGSDIFNLSKDTSNYNENRAHGFTIQEDSIFYVYIYVGSADRTFDKLTYDLQIVEGSTADYDYEKYTYGASPNPSYPQEIKNCGENVNLFDKDNVINAYLNANGTTTSNSTFRVSDYIDVSKFSDVTISGNYGGSEYGCFYDENKNFVSNFGMSTLTTRTVSVPNNAKYLRVTIRKDVLDQYKIEQGSTASPYSPYGMGSITEKIVNKNLLKLPVKSGTSNGVSWSIDEKGEITLNGTLSSDRVEVSPLNYLLPNGTYTASKEYEKTIALKRTNGQNIFLMSGATGVDTQTLTDETLNSVHIFNTQGTVFNNTVVKLQLKQGTTATDYVPHEEQTITIPTQQPMRSIGDVRDGFIEKDNKKYENHPIYRVRLLSSKITGFDTTYNRFALLNTDVNIEGTIVAGLCNVAKVITTGSVNANYTNSIQIRKRDAGGFTLYGWLDGITSLEEAKEYLDNNEVYVDIIGAEPTLLPCTEEQITALEALEEARTYKPVTHIYSEDEVQAVVDVEYVVDINSVITRIEKLESEV